MNGPGEVMEYRENETIGELLERARIRQKHAGPKERYHVVVRFNGDERLSAEEERRLNKPMLVPFSFKISDVNRRGDVKYLMAIPRFAGCFSGHPRHTPSDGDKQLASFFAKLAESKIDYAPGGAMHGFDAHDSNANVIEEVILKVISHVGCSHDEHQS